MFLPSGVVLVHNLLLYCLKNAYVIINSIFAADSMSLSPQTFISLSLSLSLSISLYLPLSISPSLSLSRSRSLSLNQNVPIFQLSSAFWELPNFALRYPIKTITSLFFISSIVLCSVSYKDCITSPSAVVVGAYI